MNKKRFSLLIVFLMVFAGFGFASNVATTHGQDLTEIVFFTGAQTTDTLSEMVKDYNDNIGNPDGVNISLQTSTWETQSQYDTYTSRFQAEDDTFDIISMDVIWPPSYIENGWLEPLSDVFPTSEQDKFLEAPILAGTWEGEIYGIPWFHDSGMLYYRTDILQYAADNDIIPENRAPESWEELHDWTLDMLNDDDLISEFGSDLKGHVWQGKAYEGLMCDFMEYLGGTGQTSWLDQDEDGNYTANLDTPEVRDTLEYMNSLVEDGVSPEAVLTYDEEGSRAVWNAGNAIFHRNWPYAYRLSLDSVALNGSDAGTDEQLFDVAPMPPQTAETEGARTGCLGGWQLGLNKFSNNKDKAKDFMVWITEEEQQLTYLDGNGVLPTRISAYDKDKIPGTSQDYVVDFLPAFEKALPRPVHPDYPAMSAELWEPINQAVSGAISPRQASGDMDDAVNDVLGVEVSRVPFNAWFAIIGLGTLVVLIRRRRKY